MSNILINLKKSLQIDIHLQIVPHGIYSGPWLQFAQSLLNYQRGYISLPDYNIHIIGNFNQVVYYFLA